MADAVRPRLRDRPKNYERWPSVMTCQTMGTSYEHDPHLESSPTGRRAEREKMSALWGLSTRVRCSPSSRRPFSGWRRDATRGTQGK